MVSGRNESKCQESLEIKQDEKFFTRIMSKDTSMANASTRVYYGGASGSVPFTWETRPGTPKHTFSDTSIPPLTPPPSYFSRSRSRSKSKSIQNSIFPRFRKKSNHVSPSSSMSSTTAAATTTTSWSSFSTSSSWSSWSSSFHSSPSVSNTRTHMCFSCSSSSIHDNEDDDDKDDVVDKDEHGFGSRASRLRNGVNKGRYLMKNMKNVFFSIVGHGSS